MSTSCLHHVSTDDLPRGQPSSGIDVPTEALGNLQEVGLQIAAIAAMLSVNFSGLSLAKRRPNGSNRRDLKRLCSSPSGTFYFNLVDADWCRLMQTDVAWCRLMKIRFFWGPFPVPRLVHLQNLRHLCGHHFAFGIFAGFMFQLFLSQALSVDHAREFLVSILMKLPGHENPSCILSQFNPVRSSSIS